MLEDLEKIIELKNNTCNINVQIKQEFFQLVHLMSNVFFANINPVGPFGGSFTEYFTGGFDDATYTSGHIFLKWMNFRKDHYATVTYTNIPNEERISWTSNWIYGKIVPTFQNRSTNDLPENLLFLKSTKNIS